MRAYGGAESTCLGCCQLRPVLSPWQSQALEEQSESGEDRELHWDGLWAACSRPWVTHWGKCRPEAFLSSRQRRCLEYFLEYLRSSDSYLYGAPFSMMQPSSVYLLGRNILTGLVLQNRAREIRTGVKALVLHTAKPSLVPSTTYGATYGILSSELGEIPEHQWV